MLKAVIFDFDGVIADSEPAHLAIFQRVLGEVGIFLSSDEYFARYLGYDDRGCFEAVLTDRGQAAPAALIDDLVGRKGEIFLHHLKQNLVICPGARELVHEAAPRYRLAIASGALRHEIEFVLDYAGIRKEFEHITSAEDLTRGKPDPQAFLHALRGLNAQSARNSEPIQPSECLVIEDSLPGIAAARSAGMKVLAVATTHPLEQLEAADLAVRSLCDVNLQDLERIVFAQT